MSGKYQAYPSYKDSGVMWLGDVPEKWTVTKIGYLSHKTGSGKTPKGGSEIYSDSGVLFLRSQNIYDTGIVLKEDDVVFISEKIDEEMAGSRVLNGDILLNITGASIGRTCIVPKGFPSANVNQHVCIIRTPNSLRKYLSLYLKSASTKAQIDSAQNGAAREGLNFEQLSNIVVCLPDNELERDAISNFLDHETAKIDTLIEKQQQLIALLKEKRQAVISHAVTKGLDANAPMRDSGVEWLGEVPEHWDAIPLKLVVRTRKGVAFKSVDFSDNGIRVVKASDIKQKTIRVTDVFLPEKFVHDYPKALLNSGDIILSTVGSNPDVKNSAVGQIGMVPHSLSGTLLNQNTVVFDPCEAKVLREYLFYILQMEGYRDHLDLHAHGTANQSSLSIADMLNFTICFPPVEEQREICRYLRQQQQKLGDLEKKSGDSETLLQERRTALISAAVTGKIDVRHFNIKDGNVA